MLIPFMLCVAMVWSPKLDGICVLLQKEHEVILIHLDMGFWPLQIVASNTKIPQT